MLNTVLFIGLALALGGAPALLLWQGSRMTCYGRYALALVPVGYTGTGWWLGWLAHDHFGCQGGSKHLHACFAGGLDVTALVGHGMFLGIPLVFVAAPLSLWFLLDITLKHIGSANRSL